MVDNLTNKQLTEISDNLIPVKIDGYLYENMFENIFFTMLLGSIFGYKLI